MTRGRIARETSQGHKTRPVQSRQDIVHLLPPDVSYTGRMHGGEAVETSLSDHAATAIKYVLPP